MSEFEKGAPAHSPFPIDDEFKRLWRGVAVEATTDRKIDDYLKAQVIRPMPDLVPKKTAPIEEKKPDSRKKQFQKPRDNEHLAHVLEMYDDSE